MAKESNNIPTGLYWQGKRTEVERISLPFQTIETINESRATREKEKDTLLKGMKEKKDPVWYNRLIWGDNKYVMSSLLEEFAGKIYLIYIDPPFATGADFSLKIEVGDVQWIKEPSAIEEKAYRDTWGKGLDSYLQMMYDRLVLMRDLLSEKGSIYVHLDYHVGHYLKVVMDKIFGIQNFRNEIIVKRITKNLQRQFNTIQALPQGHDMILWYSKDESIRYLPIFTANPNIEFKPEGYWKDFWSNADRPTMRYEILGVKPSTGQWKWSKERATEAVANYEDFLKSGEDLLVDYWRKQGQVFEFIRKSKTGKIEHWIEPLETKFVDTLWTDISAYQSGRKDYSTQKSEDLLERIIKASTNEGDLVADFFCGSGTTGAVTEKLGRRWIMCDIGRYAVHTTRKRLLGIEDCKPFVVQNLGKYERQYWQGVTFNNRKDEQKPIYEYIKFILELYSAEPITGCLWIHGKKGKSLVHVGAVDAPVTLSDIESAIDECKKMKQSSLDILGWEWEMGLHDVIQDVTKTKGINLSLKYIPREVMDPRAVAAGDITFYELAYLEIDVSKNKHGEFVVSLRDFVIPNHDLIPDEVRSKIKKWSDYIDYWSIDWDFNNDTFHNMWQSYRTRKDRTLELKSDPHLYDKKGKHVIMIKVIDIFGNDTTRIVEVMT
jgi:adenine-specific DNA-methyltransferase